MPLQIPICIHMGRAIGQQSDTIGQNDQIEMAGVNGWKNTVRSKLLEDLGACVHPSRSANFDEVWMQQRLHALAVAAGLDSMKFRLESYQLIQQPVAINGIHS